MAKTTDKLVIVLPKLERAEMTLRIRGLTPLLTNRINPKTVQGIEDKQQGKAGAKGPKAPRDPEQEFIASQYRFTKEGEEWDGRCGLPGSALKKAMVHAGYRFGGETMTRLRGAVKVMTPLMEIHGSSPVRRDDVGKLPQGTRPLMPIYRAEFWPWFIDVRLAYVPEVISRDQTVNLVAMAGFYIGIGAWREEKDGIFGSFEVDPDFKVFE